MLQNHSVESMVHTALTTCEVCCARTGVLMAISHLSEPEVWLPSLLPWENLARLGIWGKGTMSGLWIRCLSISLPPAYRLQASAGAVTDDLCRFSVMRIVRRHTPWTWNFVSVLAEKIVGAECWLVPSCTSYHRLRAAETQLEGIWYFVRLGIRAVGVETLRRKRNFSVWAFTYGILIFLSTQTKFVADTEVARSFIP